MLFPYKYVPHKMELMQEFIDFIFYEVWCKAPSLGVFNYDLFKASPDLHEVMKAFYYSDKKNADFFYGNIEKIYCHFTKFNTKQIKRLKWWFKSNNSIEQLCCQYSGYYPAQYTDIGKKYPNLTKEMNTFFTGLFDFEAAIINEKVGKIEEHYQAFIKVNNAGKCPFCGINDLLGEYHSKREAYDHYLPKAIYPFNSINFKNLVPACHHCNSSYKTTKNPAFQPKTPISKVARRKVFYPFSTTPYSIDVSINLKSIDVKNLKPDEIEISFGPSGLTEEIDTWRDVYGIDERYRALCLHNNEGKYWLESVLDEWKEDGRNPLDYIRTLQRLATKKPFADTNFIKKPFLEACQKAGLFNEDQLPPSMAPAEKTDKFKDSVLTAGGQR